MARNGVHVRRAGESDLDTVLELTSQLREGLLHGRARLAGRTAAERYADVVADPTCEIALAVCGEGDSEEVLGMAVLSVARTNALLEQPAVHVTHVVVASAHRRRGAGRALMARATAFADEHGLEQIVVSVAPASREAARFFARLGLTPISVRRTAPVTLVRRRLAVLERSPEPVVRRARRLAPRPARVRPADHSGS